MTNPRPAYEPSDLERRQAVAAELGLSTSTGSDEFAVLSTRLEEEFNRGHDLGLKRRVTPADVVRTLARELDVEVYLEDGPAARAVLDEGEREALVEDVADALGVRNAGASSLDVGTLSIDPTQIPAIFYDREALAGAFRAFGAVTRGMADRFAAAAEALEAPRP